MNLCDKCGAAAVISGKARPLSQVWGANRNYYHQGKCGGCGQFSDVADYPDIVALPRPAAPSPPVCSVDCLFRSAEALADPCEEYDHQENAWHCSLKKGHSGPHIACGGKGACQAHIWKNK